MRESSLDFKNSQEKPSDDNKIKLVIVENSDQVVDAARDAADAAMTEQKGKAGLFKRIFKHNLFYDYFRQKEIRKAKNDIQESGNVFVREGGKKEDHDLEMRRIVEQFCDEGDELIHRDAGEAKRVLGSEPKEREIAGRFKQLIYDYAEGKISDQVLEEEKSRIYSELKGVDENLVGKGQLFADNLKEVALQVRQAMEHSEGKAKLDLDLEVIVGKTKSGVRTEAQYNAVDKAVDFVSRHTGSFVNEATLGTAVSLIYGTSTKIAQTLARSKAAAVATFGGAALATGAIAGAREHRRLKMERSQIAREQAVGKKNDPENSPRRKEFEEFKYDVRDANSMFNSLADSIYEHGEDGKLALKEGVTQEQFENAIASLSDIESRIKLSNTQKIDLISYSDVTKVGIERQNLDILRARTKKDLRKLLESNPGALKLPEGMTPDDYIRKNIDLKTKNLIYGDKGLEKKDKAFSKMAKHKAFKAGIKAVGVGLVVGAGAQEIAAIFNPDVHGLLEPNEAHAAVNEGSQSVERLTPLESLRRWMMGENVQSPINAHQELAHNITAPEKLSPHEYLQQHLQSTKHIHRDIWYDNDTPKPVFDKNELKLHWGGEHGTGIDENGNFVYNIKKMMPDGSYHGNFSVDAQQAIAEGKVKLFLSMSRDTQMHPFEVKIDTNGNAIIPKDSELAKVFFENHNGHAKFLGRFAEVGQDFGEKEGIDHLRILATHEGKGLEQIIGAPEPVAPLIPPAPAPLEHEVDLPWIIPIVGRTPLEPTVHKPSPEGPEHLPYGELKLKKYYTEIDYYKNSIDQLSELFKTKLDSNLREKYKHVLIRLDELVYFNSLSNGEREKYYSELERYNLRLNKKLGINEFIKKEINNSYQHIENILIEESKLGEKPFTESFYKNSPLINGIERSEEILLILDNPIGDAVLTVPVVNSLDQYLKLNNKQKKIVVVSNNAGLFKCLENQFEGNVEVISTKEFGDYVNQNGKKERFIINTNKHFERYDSLGLSDDDVKDLSKVMSVDWASWQKEEFPILKNKKIKYDAMPARIMRNFEIMFGQRLFDNINGMDKFIERDVNSDAKAHEMKQKLNIKDDEKVIVVSAGSSIMPKEYTPERWKELLTDICSQYKNAHIVFLDDSNTEKANKYGSVVDGLVTEKNFKISRIKAEMKDMNTIMSMAELTITPDTGLGHYASAMGIPNIMFMLSDPVRWSTAKTIRVKHPKAIETYKMQTGSYSRAWSKPNEYYVEDGGEKVGASDIDPKRIMEEVRKIMK